MLILGFFRASALLDPLEPLLEMGETAFLCYDRDKMLIIMEDDEPDNDGRYDAYLRLDVANFGEYYLCDEVGARELELAKFHSYLESKQDLGDEFWSCISKVDIDQNHLIFEIGTFLLFYSPHVHVYQFGDVDCGYVDRRENYRYRIKVKMFDDNFAQIIHQVQQSFKMKISHKEVEIEEHGIVLKEEDNQCEIEGVGAGDEPYRFTLKVKEINLGAFLKASTMSNKVCLYINKPGGARAMLEFHIPQVGSFMFYYLRRQRNQPDNNNAQPNNNNVQ